jgi:hypothetical protein
MYGRELERFMARALARHGNVAAARRALRAERPEMARLSISTLRRLKATARGRAMVKREAARLESEASEAAAVLEEVRALRRTLKRIGEALA